MKMSEIEFPTFEPAQLVPFRVLAALLEENPDALNDQNCPYSEELKTFLVRFKPVSEEGGVRSSGFLGQHASKWDALETEAGELYNDLRAFRNNLSTEDVAEQMSYFRTATSLLEKIIGINERALGLKRISEFQEAVLDVIENTLSPSQRTEVMDRLRAQIDGKESISVN